MYTAEQYIYCQILKDVRDWCIENDYVPRPPIKISPADAIEIAESLADEFDFDQELKEFRHSGDIHDWPCKTNCYSRHYESDLVVRELDDGTWIGWIYWHGGGKHGEPGAIDWIHDAKVLSVASEREEVIKVRTFKLAEENEGSSEQ